MTMTASDIENMLIGLERRVSMLEDNRGTKATPQMDESTFSFDKLQNAWANKQVRKDPKFWKGPSYEGKLYSECPADYMKALASSMTYRAAMSKDDPKSQEKNKAGKTWAEVNAMEAKIARTWAAAKAAGHSIESDPF